MLPDWLVLFVFNSCRQQISIGTRKLQQLSRRLRCPRPPSLQLAPFGSFDCVTQVILTVTQCQPIVFSFLSSFPSSPLPPLSFSHTSSPVMKQMRPTATKDDKRLCHPCANATAEGKSRRALTSTKKKKELDESQHVFS